MVTNPPPQTYRRRAYAWPQAAEAGQQLEDDAAAEGWLSAEAGEDAEAGGEAQQQQAPGRLHEYVQGAYNRLLHSRRLRSAEVLPQAILSREGDVCCLRRESAVWVGMYTCQQAARLLCRRGVCPRMLVCKPAGRTELASS